MWESIIVILKEFGLKDGLTALFVIGPLIGSCLLGKRYLDYLQDEIKQSKEVNKEYRDYLQGEIKRLNDENKEYRDRFQHFVDKIPLDKEE